MTPLLPGKLRHRKGGTFCLCSASVSLLMVPRAWGGRRRECPHVPPRACATPCPCVTSSCVGPGASSCPACAAASCSSCLCVTPRPCAVLRPRAPVHTTSSRLPCHRVHRSHRILMPAMCHTTSWCPSCPCAMPHPHAIMSWCSLCSHAMPCFPATPCPGAHHVLKPIVSSCHAASWCHHVLVLIVSSCHAMFSGHTTSWCHCVLMPMVSWFPWCPHATLHPRAMLPLGAHQHPVPGHILVPRCLLVLTVPWFHRVLMT